MKKLLIMSVMVILAGCSGIEPNQYQQTNSSSSTSSQPQKASWVITIAVESTGDGLQYALIHKITNYMSGQPYVLITNSMPWSYSFIYTNYTSINTNPHIQLMPGIEFSATEPVSIYIDGVLLYRNQSYNYWEYWFTGKDGVDVYRNTWNIVASYQNGNWYYRNPINNGPTWIEMK